MQDLISQRLKESDFRRLSGFIYAEAGIKMPDSKRVMLEARLRKRLKALDLRSFSEYCDLVFGPHGAQEIVLMLDAVTTNKTEFFREEAHFRYLGQHALPSLAPLRSSWSASPLMVWSAGCSTGEEPYSLAIALSEYAKQEPAFRFTIVATDLSTGVLNRAKNAVYEEDRVKHMPLDLKRKYLLRSRDRSRGLIRICSEIRQKVKFRRLNFMDEDFGFREPLDIIFCRNVIIYFDRPTQERLIEKFCGLLAPGGYLFLGHSETIHGMDAPLVPAAPTVYRRRA